MERGSRVWLQVVARAEGTPLSVEHVCLACHEALPADGVGVSVITTAGREPVCGVGAIADRIEELQATLGEGPSIDAGFDGRSVLVPDIAGRAEYERWPVFAPSAAEAGARGMFALPLQVGPVRLGVFTVTRHLPGPLLPEQLTDASIYADVATALILDARTGMDARAELGARAGLDARAQLDAGAGTGVPPQSGVFEALTEKRMEVHQATGMVSVQLGIGVDDALVRLRAYAYAYNRRLIDVARDVVERRIRFAPDHDPDPS